MSTGFQLAALIGFTILNLIVIAVWIKALRKMKKEKSQRRKVKKEDDPYESIDDWYNDIRHFKWPLIVLVIVLILLVLFLQLT